jgi:hypothetical protein
MGIRLGANRLDLDRLDLDGLDRLDLGDQLLDDLDLLDERLDLDRLGERLDVVAFHHDRLREVDVHQFYQRQNLRRMDYFRDEQDVLNLNLKNQKDCFLGAPLDVVALPPD